MRRVIWLALLAAACSGENPKRASPPPGRSGTPPPPHLVVAWVNDQPISRDALLDSTLDLDYKGTVDRHIVRMLMEERKQKLGIMHTEAEVKDRARIFVRRMKDANPASFAQGLQRRGITEVDLVDEIAAGGSLRQVFGNEKAAVYDLISGGGCRAEVAFLNSIEEADRYHQDPESVKPRELLKDVRLARTLYPASFRKDLVDQILTADPTDPARRSVRAGLKSGLGAVHVTIREKIAPVPGAYADLKGRVVSEILQKPPDPHELEMWANALFSEARVKYDASRIPPGN